MRNAWIVRPYPHGIYRVKEFLDKNIVAIGWPRIGDLTDKKTRADIKAALETYYDYSSPQSLGQAAGNIYRFKEEIKEEDYVLVPDGTLVYIGTTDSDYKYDKDVDSNELGYPHQRGIKWLYDKRAIKRNMLTGRVFDSLKGQQTVFTTYYEDIENIVKTKKHLFTEISNTEIKKDYLIRLQQGLLSNVNSNTFEEAARSLFKNYFPGIRRLSTTSSKKGDTDLLAELPGEIKVRVQVKHFYVEGGDLKAWVVDQLTDSMDIGDKGIVVTSGRVSEEAKKRAEAILEKSISFIDGEQFVELLFESIDEMDREALAVFGLTNKIDFL